jgi:hypothetical protein
VGSLGRGPVFSASLLDELMKNPHFITSKWKKKTGRYHTYIYFWNTIYKGEFGELYVRCLFWNRVYYEWNDLYECLDNMFGIDSPALLNTYM